MEQEHWYLCVLWPDRLGQLLYLLLLVAVITLIVVLAYAVRDALTRPSPAAQRVAHIAAEQQRGQDEMDRLTRDYVQRVQTHAWTHQAHRRPPRPRRRPQRTP